MSIRVRSRGPRRRGSTTTLVRTSPKGLRRFPPSPWIGAISRFAKPTVQTDYLSLATGSWSTDHFYDAWTPSPSPTFGGHLWTCQYHVLAAPVSSANGAETSVILPPVRFTVCEPDSTGDAFDVWGSFPGLSARVAANDFMQIFGLNTFLPVSDNSHVSAGKPTRIKLGNIFAIFPQAANVLLGWAGNTFFMNFPFPNNWRVAAKYLQFRKNGSAYGTLVNKTTTIARGDNPDGNNPNRLAPGFFIYDVTFPSNPVDSSFPANEQEAWEFEFDAGDTIEVDIWFEAKIKNNGIAETLPLLINLPETNDFYGDRIGKSHTGAGWTWLGYPTLNRDCQVTLYGLKVAYGFDPSVNTYSFTPSDGTFVLGTARSPAMLFDVTSKRIQWRYDVSTPATAGMTYTTFVSSFGATRNTRLEFLTVQVGAVLTLRLASGGDTFSYTSATTNTTTLAAAVKVAIDAFIAARPGDPYWGSVTTAIPPANPWVINITYPVADTLIVSASTASGPISKYVELTLDYADEMAWIQLNRSDLPRGTTAWYRPQSSGDYITQVDDEFDGTLLSGPTGVFDHMGTTVFELWKGAQASPYDGRGTLPADFPSTITVSLTTQ